MALPFGVVTGSAAALFGLAFGVLAARSNAPDGRRKSALLGITMNSLALFVAEAEVIYVLVVE